MTRPEARPDESRGSPRGPTTGIRIAVTAVGVAAAVEFGFDALIHRAAGAAPGAGYAALYLGLTALAVLAVAIASCGFARPARPALAIWGALHAAMLTGAASAAAIGPATWWLLPEAPRNRGTAGLGVVTATAICLAFVVAPRASRRIHPGLDESLVVTLVYVAALAAGAFALRRTSRPGRSAWPVPAALTVLAGLAAVPLWTGRSQPDRHPPRFEPGSGEPQRPNLIVLILDTVGANQVTLDGATPEADTTPFLRGLLAPARRGVHYPLAHSTSTWTVPAHASLFTGMLPSQNGVHEPNVYDIDEIAPPTLRAERTLAERVRERGYRTACIFANPWLAVIPGFERGFDWFAKPIGRLPYELLGEALRQRFVPLAGSIASVDADLVNDRVLRFLELCAPGPCFVVANYLDAHAPYTPGPGYLGRFGPVPLRSPRGPPAPDAPESVRTLALARHREEILELDAAIGRLVAALEQRRILDRSWLFVTSDHGEAFGEHGLTDHGTTVYGEVTRIPLVVRPPVQERLEPYSGAVSLLDVAATIAAIAGAEPLGSGRDLREPVGEPTPAPIEFFGNPRKADLHGALAAEPARAVVLGTTKLIEQRGRRELYRLDQDLGERVDLSALDPAAVERLSALLPPLRSSAADAPTRGRLSFEGERELRALGYLE